MIKNSAENILSIFQMVGKVKLFLADKPKTSTIPKASKDKDIQQIVDEQLNAFLKKR